MDLEEQKNSEYRGTVDTEEQWTQRNNRHRRTMGTEEPTEEHWAQRRTVGAVGTDD